MLKQRLFKNKEYYLFAGLPHSDLICTFSNRSMGNMSLVYGNTSDSLDNRKIFLERLGIDYQDLVCVRQVHASRIKYVKEEDKGKGALSYESAIDDTDAFITDKKKLPLAIFTADCLSIFLYDPKTSGIGLIHAGWRSTQENITIKTAQLMAKKLNTKAKDLYVGFGPAIRECCYEVGEEFINLFSGDLIKINGCYFLDLVEINKKQLLDLGIKDANIFDSKICTSCQNIQFFSYRKEGNNCGRTMSVIMLR